MISRLRKIYHAHSRKYLISFKQLSNLFNHHGNSMASADTEGSQAIAGAFTLLHFMNKSDQNSGAGGPNGMSYSDSPSIDIDFIRGQFQFPGHGQGLGRESFVGLYQIKVIA